IQRRGRTGRTRYGRVVLLITEETRDVGYQRAEARREKEMHRVIRKLAVRGRKAAGEEAPTAPAEGGPAAGRTGGI
ncbi:MAG: hypothetical protein ACREDE_11255, partial [Thermoplasmata archaeon]